MAYLSSSRVGTVAARDQTVDLGVPNRVVHAVEDPAELALVDVERMPEAHALIGVPHLPGMLGRDRRDEVRVDDPALHQVDGAGVEVVAQPVVVVEALGTAQPGRPEHRLAAHPLVAEVVDGVADTLVPQPDVLVDLEQQHGHQRRLPVVAMDHLRPLARLEDELERRLAEEREPLDIVRRAVEMAALEEAVGAVRLDEEALAPLDEAEPDRTVNRSAVPGHPQVVVRRPKPVDVVVAHAVVPRQDDLHVVATQLELATQAEDHVRKPTSLRHQRTLRCNHHDEHQQLPWQSPETVGTGL